MIKVEESVLHRAFALAGRAPSAHNTQPWLVRVAAEGNRLLVRADERRWLRHGDPLRRDLQLSLGAFCGALRVGLAAEGLRAEVNPAGGHFAEVVVVGETAPAPAREDASLVRQRQTSRLAYGRGGIPAASLAALDAAARTAGLRLHLAVGPERKSLDSWFFAAARESWLDDRAVSELRAWTRFDPTGRLAHEDGLSARCLALGIRETVAMAALMAGPLRAILHKSFAASAVAEQAARSELRLLSDAPVLALVVAEEATAPIDRGEGLLRLWLAATRLRLAMHPLSVLLDRRGWEVARQLGVATGQLVAALRVGHSAPPPPSRRRAVASWLEHVP